MAQGAGFWVVVMVIVTSVLTRDHLLGEPTLWGGGWSQLWRFWSDDYVNDEGAHNHHNYIGFNWPMQWWPALSGNFMGTSRDSNGQCHQTLPFVGFALVVRISKIMNIYYYWYRMKIVIACLWKWMCSHMCCWLCLSYMYVVKMCFCYMCHVQLRCCMKTCIFAKCYGRGIFHLIY